MATRRAKDAAKRKVKPRRPSASKSRPAKTELAVKAPAVAASHSPADDHEMSQVFQPRPVHLRLLTAFEAALQDGVNPSDTVIAKKLGVRRETINRWRRLNVELWRWVYEHIGQRAIDLKPLVDRRVYQLAMSGSPEHTKLYYQYVAKMELPYPDDLTGGRIIVHNNFLIPRPDYSQPAIPPAPVAKVSSIPTVSIR